MTEAIPVLAGKRIADDHGYDQVVIVARKVGGPEHVTTYGVDKAHCDVAARMGDFFKHKLMGWSRDPVAASGAPLTRQQREFVRFGLNQRNYPVNEEDFAEYVRLIEQAHGLDA